MKQDGPSPVFCIFVLAPGPLSAFFTFNTLLLRMSEEIKNSKFQIRLPLLVAAAMAFGMLIGANMFRASPGKNAQAISTAYLKFRDILSYIDRDYVDSVSTDELSDYAITKM